MVQEKGQNAFFSRLTSYSRFPYFQHTRKNNANIYFKQKITNSIHIYIIIYYISNKQKQII